MTSATQGAAPSPIHVEIHRVPEYLSLRRNWFPHPPPTQASVSPPLGQRWEEQHSLAGEGVGGDQIKFGNGTRCTGLSAYPPPQIQCMCIKDATLIHNVVRNRGGGPGDQYLVIMYVNRFRTGIQMSAFPMKTAL
jgi:hypothetical protein